MDGDGVKRTNPKRTATDHAWSTKLARALTIPKLLAAIPNGRMTGGTLDIQKDVEKLWFMKKMIYK